ncbi:MAG TPA: hypothetical protein VFW21_01985 [Mycobacterium sp.]|nr:hypothetical protein [Mycobacterium sp.]
MPDSGQPPTKKHSRFRLLIIVAMAAAAVIAVAIGIGAWVFKSKISGTHMNCPNVAEGYFRHADKGEFGGSCEFAYAVQRAVNEKISDTPPGGAGGRIQVTVHNPDVNQTVQVTCMLSATSGVCNDGNSTVRLQ